MKNCVRDARAFLNYPKQPNHFAAYCTRCEKIGLHLVFKNSSGQRVRDKEPIADSFEISNFPAESTGFSFSYFRARAISGDLDASEKNTVVDGNVWIMVQMILISLRRGTISSV